MLSSPAPEGFSSSAPASTGVGSPELGVGLVLPVGLSPMLGGGSRAHFYSLIKM